MTLREIQNKYSSALREIYSAGETSAITDTVFRFFTHLSRSEIITKENTHVDQKTAALLEEALNKLLKNVPVQHITGEAWFYKLRFEVTGDVLIPRPETEELVHEAVIFLKNTDLKTVLDIGTGSGCIPIAIKKNIPLAEIISVDISPAALEVAVRNSKLNNVTVEFREMDFISEKNFITLPMFDLIISNPPYIPEEEKNKLDKNVSLYEPHSALFVPQDDPLVFYRAVFRFANTHLNKNGRIFLEIHEDFAEETKAIFSGGGYMVSLKKDLSGKDRMLIVSAN